ncbi:MAG: hypothetical protein KGZ82_10720 [Bacteroidales bacterium]|nr:hypothetical protein [Bacteroidales bacterium]
MEQLNPTEQERVGTQNQMILRALQRGRSLTPLHIFREFGCLRASARIYDLRRMGHAVKTRMVQVRGSKRVAEYYIENND